MWGLSHTAEGEALWVVVAGVADTTGSAEVGEGVDGGLAQERTPCLSWKVYPAAYLYIGWSFECTL